MDKKSKILIFIFLILVIASVATTYYRYVILEDFDFFTDEETFQEELEIYFEE